MSYKLIKNEFARAFPKRDRDSHKGNYGKLFLLCGSRGMTGAAFLAAAAAVRSGAGLVTLVVPESLNTILESKLTEAMTLPVYDDGKGFLSLDSIDQIKDGMRGKDVVGIGPGLGRQESTARLVRELYSTIDVPIVLDADGLNAFEGNKELLVSDSGNVIITPHEGEFQRVFGKMKGPREECARDLAKKFNIVVVLKGGRTVVASPSGEEYVNMTGNPGMATGGTGDCLCGMIAAFVGQGLSLFTAAKLAVFAHGCAGDIARDIYGEISMNATDLLNAIPNAFLQLIGETG